MPGVPEGNPHPGGLPDHLRLPCETGRPLRTHPRLEGLPRPQVARLRGGRDAIHALARPEGELPATDVRREARWDGDLRRGHRLRRQPGAGGVRPRDGAALADARPTPRGPGRGDGDEPLRVLDVAAGHGVFGITVAERFPQARVTAL